jgi:Protein of unknown function (DUF3575)
MKYFNVLVLLLLLKVTTVSSQDFGYTTQDVGAELQYQPDGLLFNVQLAFNAKIHHAVIFRVGYDKIKTGSTIHSLENGDGWGGSLGYRYYFKVLPVKFFAGLRIDGCKMNVHWTKPFFQEGDTRLAFLQPTIEVGYTFLFNDKFFIIPHFAAGYKIKVYSKGENIGYSKGVIPQPGVSAGFRF